MAEHLFGITDTGRVRGNNEDVFLAKELMDGQFLLAGVIDGVGGYEGGEVAAAIAAEVILAEMEEVGRDVIAQMTIAFNLANEEILGRKLLDNKFSDMACVATVAVIDLKNNLLHYIHVGDTRLYLFRDNSLVKISHDQSFVGFLEDSGRLTEAAAMNHPKRNEINQALGLSSTEEMTDAYFETGSSPFLPGDMILICSDGLTDLIDQATITAVLSTSERMENKAAALIEQANNAGGKDNVTVVLAVNTNAPVLHDILRPAELKPLDKLQVPVADLSAGSVNVLPHSPGDDKVSKVKNNNFLVILLSVLCVVLTVFSIWLSLDHFSGLKPDKTTVVAVVPVMNSQEKVIMDSLLKIKGDTLLLSEEVFKGVIKLNKALNIDRDTLIIKAKGNIVFQRDSAYYGPAMLLSSNCKYISLNGLVFENFDTGILSYQNALDLKNVKFNNCKHPVQVMFEFPDHYYVNGRVGKKVYQTDSLAKK